MTRSRFVRVLLAIFVGLSIIAWATPVQAAGGKRIYVSMGKQRIYAYQGNTLVYSAAVVARGTRMGNFRVQNRLTLVGSIVRGWKLPYWMGIYYVGRVQNGIHGPEYTAKGGYAVVSLGCVVIRSNADAAWFFRWAPTGTPVTVGR